MSDLTGRIRITSDHPQAIRGLQPVVLLDGELMPGVTKVEYTAVVGEVATARVTLIGVAVDVDDALQADSPVVQIVGSDATFRVGELVETVKGSE